MSLWSRFVIWLLENRRDLYFRMKKIQSLGITQDTRFFDIHLELLRDNRGTQTLFERYNLYCVALATARLPGALAEAGVYRGGSAKLLCRVKGDATPLYLFDTFEGLPVVDKSIDQGFGTGQFSETSLEDVRNYLKAFPGVHFYKGFFPASALGQEPEQQRYRLVHLDLDLYQSTFDALTFFYPRMVQGGAIVSHDYNQLNAGGVKKAFEEFFADKIEPVIPLWETQCVVVKT
jgi:O-methyltransferase